MKRLILRAYIISRRARRNPVKPIKNIAKDVAVVSTLDVLVHHKAPHLSDVVDVVAAHGIQLCIRLLEF